MSQHSVESQAAMPSGSSSVPAGSKPASKPWGLMGVLVLLVASAVWFDLWAWKEHRLQTQLDAQGVKTQAVVSSYGFSTAGHTSSRQLAYDYHAPDPASPGQGKRYVDYVASTYFPMSLRAGDSFEVSYLPDDPEVHQSPYFDYTRGLLGWLVFVNVYGILALFLLVLGLRPKRNGSGPNTQA